MISASRMKIIFLYLEFLGLASVLAIFSKLSGDALLPREILRMFSFTGFSMGLPWLFSPTRSEESRGDGPLKIWASGFIGAGEEMSGLG